MGINKCIYSKISFPTCLRLRAGSGALGCPVLPGSCYFLPCMVNIPSVSGLQVLSWCGNSISLIGIFLGPSCLRTGGVGWSENMFGFGVLCQQSYCCRVGRSVQSLVWLVHHIQTEKTWRVQNAARASKVTWLGGKGVRCPALPPECNLWEPRSGRRELPSASCSLIAMCAMAHMSLSKCFKKSPSPWDPHHWPLNVLTPVFHNWAT